MAKGVGWVASLHVNFRVVTTVQAKPDILQLEAPFGGVLLGLGVGVWASAGPRKSAMHGTGIVLKYFFW